MGLIIEYISIPLGIIQVIQGFFLILFIPGYATTLALYPGKNEISLFQRIVLSVIFSMALVILIVLFIDEVLALNTTPANITGAILIFSLIALAFWTAERIVNGKISKYMSENGGDNRNFLSVCRSRLRVRLTSDDKDAWVKKVWNGIKK